MVQAEIHSPSEEQHFPKLILIKHHVRGNWMPLAWRPKDFLLTSLFATFPIFASPHSKHMSQRCRCTQNTSNWPHRPIKTKNSVFTGPYKNISSIHMNKKILSSPTCSSLPLQLIITEGDDLTSTVLIHSHKCVSRNIQLHPGTCLTLTLSILHTKVMSLT